MRRRPAPGRDDENAAGRGEHPRRGRGAQVRVDDDAHRRGKAVGILHAGVQPGVVREQRPDAGEDRARLRPEPVHVGTRGLAGNPPALTYRGGGAAVQGRGELAAQPGPASFEPGRESAIERPRLRRQQTRLDLDSRRG